MSAGSDFWARRKARVAAEDAADAEAREAAKLAEAKASLEEKSDAEVLEELELPDPDSLQRGDDFSAFMAKNVPDHIRRWALRKLWRTNPALANLDGLLDYGEDFTDKACVIENMKTAYQVGKGMMAHVEELARQAEAKAEAEAAEDATETEADREPEEIAEPEEAEIEMAYHYEAATPEEDEDFTPPPRRRMQFTFDDAPESTS